MDDLISRTFMKSIGAKCLAYRDEKSGELIAIMDIDLLPSVQPEIVRCKDCKDCKHRMPYDWMFSEVWQSQNMDDYPDNEIGCQYCDMSMAADDFCSRAERREE